VLVLSRQFTEIDGQKLPLFAGVWAIFGIGNVSGMGEALHGVRDVLPTSPGPQRAGDGAFCRRVRQG